MNITFKVIFMGRSLKEEPSSLIFLGLSDKGTITLPTQITPELKKLSENNPHIIHFKNISNVIKYQNSTASIPSSYMSYFIILGTVKSYKTPKELGFLIGIRKDLKEELIGVWPLNEQDVQDPEIITKRLNDILKKSQNYSNICLID